MDVGKVNQVSDMSLMPHMDVQPTIADQQKITSKKDNSFKDELDIKTNKKKQNNLDGSTKDKDKTVYIRENNEKIENQSVGNKIKTEDLKNKNNIKDQKIKSNKGLKLSFNRLEVKDLNVKQGKRIKTNHSEQKNSINKKIEGIKEGIIKNIAVKAQIKEKVTNTALSNTQQTTKKTAEKLLFHQTEKNNKINKKTENIKVEDFSKVIENKFKNISNIKENIEQKTDTVSKKDNDLPVKEKITILKNEPVKEAAIPVNLNLNLEKEISSSEIKLEKTGNTRQLFEQYQEISDKILNKVDNVIKYMATKGTEAISIRLQPPELGKIHIELTIKDNIINAKINTENIAVKEIIMTNIDQLKAGIENNGFNINKLDVEIGGFKNFLSKDTQNFSNKSKNGSKKNNNGNSVFNNGTEIINRPLNPYTFFVGRSVNMLV